MQSTNRKIKHADDQKTFTSQKCDWINAVLADHSLSHGAKVVAVCIVQHVNEKDGYASPSEPTIADKTGTPERSVERFRSELRAAGWITWKRRMRDSNVYWVLTGPMAAVAEHQQTLTQARKDRREEAPRLVHLDPPRVAYLAMSDPPPGWPEGFKLTPELIAYAETKNHSQSKAEEMFEKFRNNSKAKGTTFVDWDYGWRSWVDKENNFRRDEPDRNVIDGRL
jgi:hypothetical protein